MPRIAIALALILLGGCAAHGSRSGLSIEAARVRLGEGMRRAPLVATQNLTLSSTCLAQERGTVRSLTPSSTCLACHDGTSSAPSRVHDTHPVSVDYEAAWRKGSALRQVEDVPPQIVLVTGTTVECTSCHDPGSSRPRHIALPLERSTLCTGCHAR